VDDLAIPVELPILPLKDVVIYPFSGVPLAVGQERSIKLINDAMLGNRLIGFVAQHDPSVEGAGPDEAFEVGTVGLILGMRRAANGTMQLAIQGLERFEVEEYTQVQPYMRARIHLAPDEYTPSVELDALARNLVSLFQRLVDLLPHLPDDLAQAAQNMDNPRQLVYLIATTLRMPLELRQDILATPDVRSKLEKVTAFLSRELEVLELGKKLQNQVQNEVEKTQREYLLREQMKAIQKELGESNAEEAEVNELRGKIDASAMPDEARKEALRELSRLERLPAAAAEYGVIKSYLDWMVGMPWQVYTEHEIDIAHTRDILNEDHYDLEKIKDRILEYLAVRKLKEQRQGEGAAGREPILCFVGPPGVGKTSLAQSIARALSRPFTRMSLGGVHDEAEIRGHRRTYIGAMPGRIIQAIRRSEAADPVFVLDEVDKLGSDFRGDPSSALLEVLDPEQNKDFRDHYLDVPFDLSRVMFIATANILDTIPPPLRDRMEILHLSGYTEEEKLHIARRYLVPKQLKANGLTEDDVRWADDAIRTVIRDYTREAGVRNLERQIAGVSRRIARDVAVRLGVTRHVSAAPQGNGNGTGPHSSAGVDTPATAEGAADDQREQEDPAAPNTEVAPTRLAGDAPQPPAETAGVPAETPEEAPAEVLLEITPEKVREILGRQRFYSEVAEMVEQPGVATGLAWTEVGGDILFIEATRMQGGKTMTITGQLGEVMKESAYAALSWVRSHARELGIPEDFFTASDIHIHIPAGAIPKDGPSAGITMTTALASLLTGRSVRSDVAMTGEITLRGRVLPIGGLKEKALAAHRAGLKTIIIPRRNEPDLDEIPAELREEMTFIPVDTMTEVLEHALTPPTQASELAQAEMVEEIEHDLDERTPGAEPPTRVEIISENPTETPAAAEPGWRVQ
jgi:ATP-dependent Lon protease